MTDFMVQETADDEFVGHAKAGELLIKGRFHQGRGAVVQILAPCPQLSV